MPELTLSYMLPLVTSVGQAAILSATSIAYLKACDRVSQWCWDNRNLKQREVQQATYHRLRKELGMPSQMAISATRRVIGNYRTIRENQGSPWNIRQSPSYKSAGYDLVWNRDYSINDRTGVISVNTLEGRVKLMADWSRIPRTMLHGRYGTARILTCNGRWMISIPLTITLPEGPLPVNIMGVDLGMRFLAVSYDSHGHVTFHSGKEVTQKRAQYQALRTSLQKKGTRSARKRLRTIGHRENRWMRDINHQVSKALIAACVQPTLIVLEDLKGIRKATQRVRKSRRYVQVSWAFYQLRQMIEYKARQAGHTVLVIDPAYTSQTCPICGQTRKTNRRKDKHLYHCANCGYMSNDDRVAAMNIQRLGWMSLLESGVNMP